MIKAITGLQSRHKNVLQVEGGVLGQLISKAIGHEIRGSYKYAHLKEDMGYISNVSV